MAGDERRGVRAQPDDGFGDFCRCSQAPDWFHLDEPRRRRGADCQRIEGQQLPEQFRDEQPRDLIAMSDPRELSLHTQTQKCLHRNVDARYIVSIGPSHALHGGQFLLFGVGTTHQP